MHAAVNALRTLDPARIVVATPVASPEAEAMIREVADAFICACAPADFESVGRWYEDFSQTTDQEVLQLLERSAHIGQSARREATSAGAWYA